MNYDYARTMEGQVRLKKGEVGLGQRWGLGNNPRKEVFHRMQLFSVFTHIEPFQMNKTKKIKIKSVCVVMHMKLTSRW